MLRAITIAVLLLAGVGTLFVPDPRVSAAEAIEMVGSGGSEGSTEAGLAHDGDVTTAWQTVGRRPPKRAWVSFDLGSLQSLSSIEWVFTKSGFADKMTIQRSRDGKSWIKVATVGNAPAGEWRNRDIDAVAQHVRFSFANPREDRVLGSLGEVRVNGRAGTGANYATAACQRIAVPAYFDPWTHWDQAIAAAPATGLMILNPNSGVDTRFQQEWEDVTRSAQQAGIEVLGYIFTDLGRRPAAEVEQEIDRYFEWYAVDGIYLDNTPHDGDRIAYYRELAQYARGVKSAATVAMNPGYTPDERYMDFIDILETFEFDYATYRAQRFPGWTQDYPASRFMHVVHSVPDAAAASATLALAKERNAGYVFITDVDDPDVIYKSLGAHWQQQAVEVCP